MSTRSATIGGTAASVRSVMCRTSDPEDVSLAPGPPIEGVARRAIHRDRRNAVVSEQVGRSDPMATSRRRRRGWLHEVLVGERTR